jgi:peptidoglycan/LPS O-acetylase OafA/YrhL
LRTAAILLLVLYHVPGSTADVPVTVVTNYPLELVGFTGVCIFFFVSGLSLYLSNKTIRNRGDVLYFFKKRMVRIYPLYWVFVAGILIFYRPSLADSVIYIVGWQALFYPIFITVDIYHFVSVILIFYLLFPLLTFSNDLKKLLIVSLIPFLFFAAIRLRWGLSDSMLLEYYGLFVAGIVAGKADVYNKMRQANSKRFFVFTIPAFGAVLSIWLILAGRYIYANTVILATVLSYVLGVLIVLITLYWAAFYVMASRAKVYAFFTLVAFSTYAIYLINEPFFGLVSRMLRLRFDIGGTATEVILIALIPFVIVAGYLLQFITNKVTNFPRNQKH